MQPLVWIVGDHQHADFCECLSWLERGARCVRYRDPQAALAGESSQFDPHAIVIFQSRPGEFAQGEVERLHAAAPLARLIALTGTWCEGEGRSGRPWLGVTRVPWRGWRSRLPLELGWHAIGSQRAPLRPRTTTDRERIEHSLAASRVRRFAGLAHIHTDSRLTYETLADALSNLGLRPAWRTADEPSAQPDLVLLDGRDHAAAAIPARSILLLHFPRPEDVAAAGQLGVHAMVAQPLLLADLAIAVAGILPGQVVGALPGQVVRQESAA